MSHNDCSIASATPRRKSRAKRAAPPLLITPTEISLTLVLGNLVKAQDALAVAANDMASFARECDLLQNVAVEIALHIRQQCANVHDDIEALDGWLRLEREELARLAERRAA